ncbi:MAG: translational GTPase TypA [Candidatus Xenobium sp.]|jgi:GTP-binding protein|nr:translational GTPase TypA [Burkholderiales bacterium]
MQRTGLRNLAIIAHIDHGKTTLVDGLLRQAGVFRAGQEMVERIMDSNDLERERGITILAKNTSVRFKETTLNIVDTPGHVDFSSEVERILGMVDGALLVVDAFEGPMAQTRFVVKKTLQAGLVPILVINKIDRPDARPQAVVDEVLELFIDLDAEDHQIEFPVVYASARQQVASLSPDGPFENLQPLYETIIKHIPCPEGDPEAPLQLLVSNLDYDEYVGRLAIGRVVAGEVHPGKSVCFGSQGGALRKGRIGQVLGFFGLDRKPIETATVGDLVALTGLPGVGLGDTVTDVENPLLLPGLRVEEPILAMTFLATDSPLAGRDGRYITSRHLRDRLFREAERNVGLHVQETDSPDAFEVCGRGELHLSILLETMRREGYELSVSAPRVLTRIVDGVLHEPIEELTLDIPEECLGAIMERVGERRGELVAMKGSGTGRIHLEFTIPARGLVGFYSECLTLTRGYGVMNHIFSGYGPFRGEITRRTRGSLVAGETGPTTTYALTNLQDRGVFFIEPGEQVYTGMVVGEHCRPNDLDVNVCKKKHVTNMRSSTAEETVRLDTARKLTLEQALGLIGDDELVEITPSHIRLRKSILDPHMRLRAKKDRQRLEEVG